MSSNSVTAYIRLTAESYKMVKEVADRTKSSVREVIQRIIDERFGILVDTFPEAIECVLRERYEEQCAMVGISRKEDDEFPNESDEYPLVDSMGNHVDYTGEKVMTFPMVGDKGEVSPIVTEPYPCNDCGNLVLYFGDGIYVDADHDLSGKDITDLIEHDCSGENTEVESE